MRIIYWSSDVCSSDLVHERAAAHGRSVKTYSMLTVVMADTDDQAAAKAAEYGAGVDREALAKMRASWGIPLEQARAWAEGAEGEQAFQTRSEEHTSELQSLMRISYAVFCLKKKKTI